MKALKVFLPVIMIAVLALGWLNFLSGIASTNAAYNEALSLAEESAENLLNEQAIEYYKEALSYKNSEDIYLQIKNQYDLWYAEEHIDFVRDCYIEDMNTAALLYPKNELFWTTQIELYLAGENYSKAYNVASRAYNYGAEGETLDMYYYDLLYMMKESYKKYYDCKTALNGYYSMSDGEKWYVLDDSGAVLINDYDFIGIINEDGRGLFVNSIGTRILDSNQTGRARFDFTVEDAGYLNDADGYINVKTDGKWRYCDLSGKFLDGEYDVAGSFYAGKAAAKRDDTWYLVDTEGKEERLDFEDIKLDLYGCHDQNGVVIAKKDGKYRLYTPDFEQIGSFEADNTDICVNGEYIAFEVNGLWGFADTEGNVVKEPEYAKAKSFANGYAAVCSDNGLWGFLNDEFKLVIDFKYIDAHYFNESEKCLVSTEAGTYQFAEFMF